MDERGEAPGDRGIGIDRSLQIRQEIERISRFLDQKASTYLPIAEQKYIERAATSPPKESGSGFVV